MGGCAPRPKFKGRIAWLRIAVRNVPIETRIPRSQGRRFAGPDFLEPVINFPVGRVASANCARRGGGRRLWLFQGEDDNEAWHNLRRNPSGWGRFSRFLCRSSLEDTRYSSLLPSRTRQNRLPARPTRKLITSSRVPTPPLVAYSCHNSALILLSECYLDTCTIVTTFIVAQWPHEKRTAYRNFSAGGRREFRERR